jgi:DNA-binding MarR family transcriptional regulator
MSPTSRPASLTPAELAAWHGMLGVHAEVLRTLDRRMRAEHGLAVTEFDVLITLFNADGARLRMMELAAAIMLSPAGLTHLVTRLERDALVTRRVDPADRRSVFVSLTTTGQATLDAARVTHDAVIRERFTDRLSRDQLQQLAQAWAAVQLSP